MKQSVSRLHLEYEDILNYNRKTINSSYLYKPKVNDLVLCTVDKIKCSI